jgi:magnesium-transporting ATPase (P-type)
VDESMLTGETALISKSAADGENEGGDPFVVSGTNIMQGT